MSKFDNILATVLAVVLVLGGVGAISFIMAKTGIGFQCLLPSTSKEPLTLTEEHVIERDIEPIMEEPPVIERDIEPIMENISAQVYGFSNDDAEIKSIEVDGRECIAIIGKRHSAISCNWSKQRQSFRLPFLLE